MFPLLPGVAFYLIYLFLTLYVYFYQCGYILFAQIFHNPGIVASALGVLFHKGPVPQASGCGNKVLFSAQSLHALNQNSSPR